MGGVLTAAKRTVHTFLFKILAEVRAAAEWHLRLVLRLHPLEPRLVLLEQKNEFGLKNVDERKHLESQRSE